MCTSHVAGNTQRLVSMGKVRKDGLCGSQSKWQGLDKDVVEITVLAYDWRFQKDEIVVVVVVHGLQYVGEDAAAPLTELSK